MEDLKLINILNKLETTLQDDILDNGNEIDIDKLVLKYGKNKKLMLYFISSKAKDAKLNNRIKEYRTLIRELIKTLRKLTC